MLTISQLIGVLVGVWVLAVRVYDSASAIIITCTILNSDTYDISIGDSVWQDGKVILINTTFDEDKVAILDEMSNLTVKWYLHVRAIDDYNVPVVGV